MRGVLAAADVNAAGVVLGMQSVTHGRKGTGRRSVAARIAAGGRDEEAIARGEARGERRVGGRIANGRHGLGRSVGGVRQCVGHVAGGVGCGRNVRRKRGARRGGKGEQRKRDGGDARARCGDHGMRNHGTRRSWQREKAPSGNARGVIASSPPVVAWTVVFFLDDVVRSAGTALAKGGLRARSSTVQSAASLESTMDRA